MLFFCHKGQQKPEFPFFSNGLDLNGPLVLCCVFCSMCMLFCCRRLIDCLIDCHCKIQWKINSGSKLITSKALFDFFLESIHCLLHRDVIYCIIIKLLIVLCKPALVNSPDPVWLPVHKDLVLFIFYSHPICISFVCSLNK